MKHTIELDGTYVVTSRAQECAIDLGALSTDIVHKLALHGLTQKIADAASQAAKDLPKGDPQIAINTEAMMGKAADALLAGEWSTRTASDGADEATLVARSIMRGLVKAKYGKDTPEWKAFIGLPDADQLAKLDALCAENSDALAPQIETRIATRKAEREAKNKLAGKVTFSL